MVSTCIVPGCKTNRGTKIQLSVFRVPRDQIRKRKWEKAVGFPLFHSHRVCEKHFAPEEIMRHTEHRDNKGNLITRIPLRSCKLARHAVPFIKDESDSNGETCSNQDVHNNGAVCKSQENHNNREICNNQEIHNDDKICINQEIQENIPRKDRDKQKKSSEITVKIQYFDSDSESPQNKCRLSSDELDLHPNIRIIDYYSNNTNDQEISRIINDSEDSSTKRNSKNKCNLRNCNSQEIARIDSNSESSEIKGSSKIDSSSDSIKTKEALKIDCNLPSRKRKEIPKTDCVLKSNETKETAKTHCNVNKKSNDAQCVSRIGYNSDNSNIQETSKTNHKPDNTQETPEMNYEPDLTQKIPRINYISENSNIQEVILIESESENSNQQVTSKIDCIDMNSRLRIFLNFCNSVPTMLLPRDWFIRLPSSRDTILFFTVVIRPHDDDLDSPCTIEKSLLVRNTMKVIYTFRGKNIDPKILGYKDEFSDFEELQETLKHFASVSLCTGIEDFEGVNLVRYTVGAEDEDGILRHKNCTLYTHFDKCEVCCQVVEIIKQKKNKIMQKKKSK